MVVLAAEKVLVVPVPVHRFQVLSILLESVVPDFQRTGIPETKERNTQKVPLVSISTMANS